MGLEWAISLLSTIATIVGSIATLAYWLGRRLAKVEFRLKEVEGRIGELEGRLGRRVERLGEAFIGYQEFLVEYLSAEGVIKRAAVEMLRNEARRLIGLASANPFTREELKRLKELLDKDELALEEALELRELARKAVREYGHYPEAWKLHIYASIMVGLARRREGEENATY